MKRFPAACFFFFALRRPAQRQPDLHRRHRRDGRRNKKKELQPTWQFPHTDALPKNNATSAGKFDSTRTIPGSSATATTTTVKTRRISGV